MIPEPEPFLTYLNQNALTLLSKNYIVNERTFNLKQSGWCIVLNNSKCNLGTCIFNYKTITLSSYLLKVATKEVILDTILHEIAHGIDFEIRGKSDHGLKWRSIAKQVGCLPIRLYSGSKLPIESPKYYLVCDNCFEQVPSHRKRKREVACLKCCSKHNNAEYTPKYALRIVKNH